MSTGNGFNNNNHNNNNDEKKNNTAFSNTNHNVEGNILSSSASLAFWMTGVVDVTSEQLHSAVAEERETNDNEEKKNLLLDDNDDDEEKNLYCDHSSSKNKESLSTPVLLNPQRVIWVRDTRTRKKNGGSSNHHHHHNHSNHNNSNINKSGVNGNKNHRSGNTNTPPLPPPTTTTTDTPVHIIDETVMCNLVPMLPRTHAEYALVSQIVPCTVWPPLTHELNGKTSPVSNLQEAAALTSQLHQKYLRLSTTPPTFSAPSALPGALVEWVTGSVGYTADTEGLWEEQRIVAERYYHLVPVPLEENEKENEIEKEEKGKEECMRVPKVIPRVPPSTVRGAVMEQLLRFRGVEEERKRLGETKDHWIPRFARLMELTHTCIMAVDEIVSKLSAGISVPSSECDLMLDEIFLIGIVPRGDPHRLSLLCPSEAHRILTENQHEQKEEEKAEEKQQNDKHHSVYMNSGNTTNSNSTCNVTEILLDMILQSLRDTLQRRIGVQYELLRILRVRALALAHRDMLLQYTHWYTTVPTPLAVMYILAASTLFGPLMAQRWPRKTIETQQISGFGKSGGGTKRQREEEDHNELQKNEEEEEENNEQNTEDMDENDENDDDAPSSLSTLRDGMSSGNDTLPSNLRDDVDHVRNKNVLHVPCEVDLLDDDYMTRFATWLRCNANHNSNNHNGSSSSSSNHNVNHHSRSNGGGGNGNSSGINGGNSSSGCCDEAALTATVGWLRRRKRTMTLKELDAFARKKH